MPDNCRPLQYYRKCASIVAISCFCILLFAPVACRATGVKGHSKTTVPKASREANFRHIPICCKNTPYAYTIRPRTIDLKVRESSTLLSTGLTRGDINAYVDLKGLAPGIYVKPVTIKLPEGASLIKAVPQVFVIKIQSTRTH